MSCSKFVQREAKGEGYDIVEESHKLFTKLSKLTWRGRNKLKLYIEPNERNADCLRYLKPLPFAYPKTLIVGDFHFVLVDSEGKEHLMFVIERKQFRDHSSSIKNRHEAQQRERLKLLQDLDLPKWRIIWLIEGWELDAPFFCGWSRFIGALTNLVVRDGMQVHNSASGAFTCFTLLKLAMKLHEFNVIPEDINQPSISKSDAKRLASGDAKSVPFLDTILIKKKDNFSPRLCYAIYLANMPGVGKAIAREILEVWPSLEMLFKDSYSADFCERLGALQVHGRSVGIEVAKVVQATLLDKPVVLPVKVPKEKKEKAKPKPKKTGEGKAKAKRKRPVSTKADGKPKRRKLQPVTEDLEESLDEKDDLTLLLSQELVS